MGSCFPKPIECQCYELLILDNDDTLSDLPMMKLYRRKPIYKNLKRKRMTNIYQIYKMESAKLLR